MKKLLSLVLVLALLCSTALLIACGTETPAEDEENTTTTTTTTTRRTEKEDDDEKEPEEEIKVPDLADGTKFALDGDLAEWAETKTLFLQGEANENLENSGNKKVTFYGVLADDGLHLACDAYHDIYIPDATSDWWKNSNYEFFVGTTNAQKYVYARGIGVECSTSGSDVQAVMVTEEINGITKFHTITEVFVPMEELAESDIYYNTIDVGVAWKTIGDVIIGGAGTYGPYGEDEYWVPKGTWPNNSSKAIVAPSGIYLPEEYNY